MAFPYTHVRREDGGESLVVILPDGPPVVFNDDHPHFERALAEVSEDDPSAVEVRELADLSFAVARHFERLSERVAVADGHVYFDGDLVDSTIARQIVRFLQNGVRRWQPLVSFMENLAANPNDHSREQLYDWLRNRDFTITESGSFLAYKGVRSDFTSINSGPAVVDGEAVNGHVPNRPGSVVEIARSAVEHNPGRGCASGLHAGTFAYAQGFAQGGLLSVEINPRDVVSVPTDCEAQKLRVSRYRVLRTIDAPHTAPQAWDESDDDFECDCGADYCDECGAELA